MIDTTRRTTAVGVFDNRDQAERAVDELFRAGFTNEQIGFAVQDTDRLGTAEEAQGAGEGAAAGAVTGGVIGGLLGAAAALLIPGVGPVVAGGVLASAIGGAALGATTGGLLGALVGMGVPEEEARYYQGEVQAGRTLVTVNAGNRYEEAVAILRRNGGYEYSARDSTMGLTDDMEYRSSSAGNIYTTSSRSWPEVSSDYRTDWEREAGRSGRRWEDVEPSYHYGYEMASDTRYQGRDWTDVEPNLRSNYAAWARERGYRADDSAWEQLKDDVRRAWDHARGRTWHGHSEEHGDRPAL